MVLGTKLMMTENNWCGQEVGIGGVNCKEFYLTEV